MRHVCVYHSVLLHMNDDNVEVQIRFLFVFIGTNLVCSLPSPCGRPPFRYIAPEREKGILALIIFTMDRIYMTPILK